MDELSIFKDKLTKLINECSIDTYTGIPDFILSEQLVDHAKGLQYFTEQRDHWFGFHAPILTDDGLLGIDEDESNET